MTKRVQFDFSEVALQQLDRIKDLAGASSRAELVRNSVTWYHWLLSKSSEGYKIQAIKDDQVETVPFLTLNSRLVTETEGVAGASHPVGAAR